MTRKTSLLDRFHHGQAVRATDYAVRNGVLRAHVRGIVTAVGDRHLDRYIYVRRLDTGAKKGTQYYAGFWEPDPEAPSPPPVEVVEQTVAPDGSEKVRPMTGLAVACRVCGRLTIFEPCQFCGKPTGRIPIIEGLAL